MKTKNTLFEDPNIFKTIFDQSYNSIVVTDAQIELPGPRFLYVNKAFTKITGYTLEDLEGKTPRVLQGKNTDMEVIAHLKKCLINSEFFTGSTINYTKDGQEYYVEWNISPIKDENGKTIYFTSVQKDITEKVLLEKRLKKEQKEKDIALRKIAMKEIMERIAHHWRQHLSAISGAVSNIQIDYELSGSLDENIDDVLDSIKDISNETQELSNIITLFEQFGKDTNMPKEDIFIKSLVDEILQLYTLDIQKNNIEVQININDNLKLHTNKQQLLQVILPIVDNSIYFLKEANPDHKQMSITVKTIEDLLTIEIKDNANGISNEILDYIFEAYFSTKNEKNDTGLGLYIVKNILEEVYQGSMRIENIKNGLKVSIDIPMA